MSGRIIHMPKPEITHDNYHPCQGIPAAEFLVRGTQWQCDSCDRIWVVVEGAQYNESYSAWRILTDRNKDGRDRL